MPLPIPETLAAGDETAVAKATMARTSLGRYLVSAMLAGAFVGVAFVLLLATSSSFIKAQSPSTKLVQGSVFGIALTLVVFAGAELFTGCAMTMIQGLVRRKTNVVDLLLVWVASWIGNLIGALVFAAVVNASGFLTAGATKGTETVYFAALAGIIKSKAALSAGQLFLRGVLCNFLVCLGLWMAQRTQSDAAKAIVVFWALLAFIASGFEHCVANMTVFLLGIFGNVPGATGGEMARNLTLTTLGNIVGGGLVVGLAYAYIGGGAKTAAAAAVSAPATVAYAAPVDEYDYVDGLEDDYDEYDEYEDLDIEDEPVVAGPPPRAATRRSTAKVSAAPAATTRATRTSTPPPARVRTTPTRTR